MGIYFFLIKIAALLGHRKAKLLVEGQANTLNLLRQEGAERWRNAIWFHAASVGEFEQARPIIEALKVKVESERPKIILTFFSPSGFEMRKNYDKVDGVFYLPFATHRNAVSFLTALQPKMAIFIKYEFWPAYLKELKRRAIPTYSVSAIFRESQLFFKPWGGAYRSLLHCFTKLFVQDEASKALLNKFQIDEVEVTGDTRFDRVSEIAKQAKEIALVQQFSRVESESESGKCRVLMAGSTWPEDEELLARYVEEHEDVKLVLVPHEIDEEHLHRIFQIFKGQFVRYTQTTPMNIQHTRVLVVDTMGLLSSLYRYADVAYIGGGFGVGIHNTLEAAVYGIPVLFGPNYQRFREAVGLIAAGASRSVSNYDELRDGLDNAFANQPEMGAKAKAFVESGCGATQSILRSLKLTTNN